ncbi:hypothetical protein PR048_019037 [Dryococelus australis]|uniref:Uncharacterized protein n=1 Tax=Dryococelus australis TaxID=614101 RepID=A0ABQ9H2C7_9NEOP|nr:hypothetical protein PR048_019037 [Dryococelus australis]
MWIHVHYTVPKCWQSDDVQVVHVNNIPEQCLIIVHAGGEMGFIPGACLIYDSKLNMSKIQLIPESQQRSIVILDSALYHNRFKTKKKQLQPTI